LVDSRAAEEVARRLCVVVLSNARVRPIDKGKPTAT